MASDINVISLFEFLIAKFAVLTTVGTVSACLVKGSVFVPVGLATIWKFTSGSRLSNTRSLPVGVVNGYTTPPGPISA